MIKKLILIAALGLVSVSVFAQGFRGGGMAMMTSPSSLTRRDDVKAELQLTDDQKNKIAEISSASRAKMREIFQSAGDDRQAAFKQMGPIMAEANDQITKLLTPDQQKRLKEIQYQIGGFGLIATDKDLQTQLAITDDQKTKIAGVSKMADDANAAVGEKMRNQEIDREAGMAAMKKNGDALNSGIEALLTDAQKSKFKDLQGKHFEQTSQPGGFGRGGR